MVYARDEPLGLGVGTSLVTCDWPHWWGNSRLKAGTFLFLGATLGAMIEKS